MKTAVLGLSGGVDSSTAASQLKQNGYNVVGIYCVMHRYSEEGLCDAKRVAEHLGIDFDTVDCTKEFKDIVIRDFLGNYKHGRTPNPCTVCNPNVKFKALCDYAEKIGAENIATGHYAGVGYENGRYFVRKSADKDQSYMLWGLTQKQLSMLLLPLYNEFKPDVRMQAQSLGLPVAEKPDSLDLCFVPSGDYAAFIEEHIGKFPEGEFWLRDENRAVGTHKGIIRYTIGQRKNLGIALGTPVYVCGIDAEKNRVILSRSDVTGYTDLECEDANFQALSPEKTKSFGADVKIRYAHKGAHGTISVSGNRFSVKFDEPQRAVTPGQSAVCYDGEKVLCGGIII